MRVVQLTDCHLLKNPADKLWNTDIDLDRQLQAVIAKANQENPEVVLLTGDLSQDGSPEAYRRLSNYLSVFTCPVYAISGNHDNAHNLKMHLRALKEFYVDKHNFRIAFIDSIVPGEDAGYLSEENLAKLSEAIFTIRPTFVVLHHHPLPIDPDIDKFILKNYEEFLAKLEFSQVKAVLFGHVHRAYDVTYCGIRFLGCPSTSIQAGYKKGSEEAVLESWPGYRVIDIDKRGVFQTRVERVFVPLAFHSAAVLQS